MKDAHMNIFPTEVWTYHCFLYRADVYKIPLVCKCFIFLCVHPITTGWSLEHDKRLNEFLWKEWCVSVFSLLELTVGVNEDMDTTKELSYTMSLKI